MTTLLIAAALAAAQTAPAADPPEEAIARAVAAGRQLYDYDRAASVSSDALVAAVPRDTLTGAGGYVVEPVDPRTLRVTYYRGAAAAARAVFVADVRDGRVTRGERLADPVPLTAGQATLAAARDAAAGAAVRLSLRPCTASPFNTVVLPAAGGGDTAATVYLLTAQADAATLPMGGHYRLTVAADGTVAAPRAFSRSCLTVPVPVPGRASGGGRTAGVVVSHLLDPVPTEVHVLAANRLGLPVFVTVPDGTLWQVRGDRITRAPTR